MYFQIVNSSIYPYQEKNHTCFRCNRIYHERFASQSICFSKYMSRSNIAHNSFVAPQIYIFNSYLTRSNNSNFVNAVCYMIYKRILRNFLARRNPDAVITDISDSVISLNIGDLIIAISSPYTAPVNPIF